MGLSSNKTFIKVKGIYFFITPICLFFFTFILATASLSADNLRTLYPPIEPYRIGFLPVEGGHNLYYEESGNLEGQPILFLHGGPGMGTKPQNRCFFNPQHYRIILFDQRGCGKSTPFASLENNTTWDLMKDIETLREHLKIERWMIFGGSWGSTLALTYAIKYPERVQALILRGIFLCRPKEINWFYQNGANQIFPDLWENFIQPIPIEERGDLVHAFYNRLIGVDIKEKANATKAWALWEGKTSKLRADLFSSQSFSFPMAYAMARIECHYFEHNAFFDTSNWILENIQAARLIPCILIHGRYDVICPLDSAWQLHLAWPEATLEIIPDAGHSSEELGIIDALIRATDAYVPKK